MLATLGIRLAATSCPKPLACAANGQRKVCQGFVAKSALISRSARSYKVNHGLSSQFSATKPHKTLEEVSDPNSFWEAQDGIEPAPTPTSTDTLVASTKIERVRERANPIERPVGWRSSYSSKSLKPRTMKKQSDYLRDLSAVDDLSWEEEFERKFGGVKEPLEENLDAKPIFDAVADFDVQEFREKVAYIKKKLWKAYKAGDMAAGEREFEFLTKLQRRVPVAYSRLHAICKPCWMAMLELCISYGEHKKLMILLDRLKMTFGLFEADRALMTLRFLYEHNLSDLAKKFWNDAESANLLDERAHADIATWMQKKGFFGESRNVLEKALLRSQTDPNFVLTVHFYHAAISWGIKMADPKFLEEIIEKMKLSIPYGLSSENFGTWLQMTNNLIYGPNMMDSLSGVSRKMADSGLEIQIQSVDDYLATQHRLFSILSESLGSFGFSVSTLMREEMLRHSILQVGTVAEQINTIQEYGQGTFVFSVSCMIDSLIIHRNLEELHTLLKFPSKFFPKRSNGSRTRIPHSLYDGIASWIERFMNRPAQGPPMLKKDDSIQSSSTGVISPNQPSNISLLLGEPYMAVRLYETCFFRLSLPPRYMGKFLLHVLHQVNSIEKAQAVSSTREGAKEAVLKRQNCKIAVQMLFERLYQQTELGIVDRVEVAYPILKELYWLGFVKEADQFSYYCLQRLSSSKLGPIFAQSMISLEKRADWKAIDELWVLAKHKNAHQQEHVTKVFSQSLNVRKPFDHQASIQFLIELMNKRIFNSLLIHDEAVQLFFRLNDQFFDVPAFWALERYRRACRIPLTAKTASMLSRIICTRGDTFVRTEANVRLHNDFDSFAAPSNHRNMAPLPIEDTRSFEDIFDSWHTIFLNVIPESTRVISPKLESLYSTPSLTL